MKLLGKTLIVAVGLAAVIGTGFAAWQVNIKNQATTVDVSPVLDGDIKVDTALNVTATKGDIKVKPDSTKDDLVLSYNVKAADQEWYNNGSDETYFVGKDAWLKVSVAYEVGKECEYISLPETIAPIAPTTWIDSKGEEGYEVELQFAWKDFGEATTPLAYAKATKEKVEDQKTLLKLIDGKIEDSIIDVTFELVADPNANA